MFRRRKRCEGCGKTLPRGSYTLCNHCSGTPMCFCCFEAITQGEICQPCLDAECAEGHNCKLMTFCSLCGFWSAKADNFIQRAENIYCRQCIGYVISDEDFEDYRQRILRGLRHT